MCRSRSENSRLQAGLQTKSCRLHLAKAPVLLELVSLAGKRNETSSPAGKATVITGKEGPLILPQQISLEFPRQSSVQRKQKSDSSYHFCPLRFAVETTSRGISAFNFFQVDEKKPHILLITVARRWQRLHQITSLRLPQSREAHFKYKRGSL